MMAMMIRGRLAYNDGDGCDDGRNEEKRER